MPKALGKVQRHVSLQCGQLAGAGALVNLQLCNGCTGLTCAGPNAIGVNVNAQVSILCELKGSTKPSAAVVKAPHLCGGCSLGGGWSGRLCGRHHGLSALQPGGRIQGGQRLKASRLPGLWRLGCASCRASRAVSLTEYHDAMRLESTWRWLLSRGGTLRAAPAHVLAAAA